MEEKNNKLMKGILIGALVGGAISLFDRKTREETVSRVKKLNKSLYDIGKNPAIFIDKSRKKIKNVKDKLEEASEDITYIVEKIKDIAESQKQLQESTYLREGEKEKCEEADR